MRRPWSQTRLDRREATALGTMTLGSVLARDTPNAPDGIEYRALQLRLQRGGDRVLGLLTLDDQRA